MYLLINGILVLGVSLSLLNIGPSMISAPEVSLYTLIETVLGPVWVYLGGYEAPPSAAVYGGTALILALAIHSFIALRYEHQQQQHEVDDSLEDIDIAAKVDSQVELTEEGFYLTMGESKSPIAQHFQKMLFYDVDNITE